MFFLVSIVRLLAELRDREEVYQPALSHMRRELKDKTSAYCYEANLRAEANVDAMTQRTPTISKRRLVESLPYLDHSVVSPVDHLTQQTKELREVVNTLQEVQDFTHSETEGSSLSIHARGQQFFPRFCRKPSRDNFVTRNLSNFVSHVVKEDTNPQASADNSTGRSKCKKHDRSSTGATQVSAWNVL